ncbi:MAG: NUDIX hydrolase [Neisseriaceae bacterium]|nr:NUDIX hydrolase [Neisseriaceae bacterium]
MITPEKQISSQQIFDGKVVRLFFDEVALPNGKTATREVVRHNGAVAVLAVTPDDKIVLVKQFRYPCNRVLLEIPAGKLDIAGENPEQCAVRELAEETPYTCETVDLIYQFYTSAGFSDEKLYLYQAHGLQRNSTLKPDEDEYLELVELNKTQANEALQNGEITDVKTIIAVQYWLLKDIQAA